ncbi:hypothetical protein BJV82DRAFT_236614 [Fennellomyces sp. T-0311]|nr:hypothetical protein BJV82DRAFT_236614 [Fennellomyces sp. T-0311]
MDINTLVAAPGETDPAVNTSLPIISHFERIPAELRFAIYSDFTFAECIRLSGRMNRYLRLNMLGWDGIVRTISDEGGHCDPSQALRPFITRFPGSRVRNIMLSNDHLWPEFMSNFDANVLYTTLERMMNILTEWNCTSINKGLLISTLTY